MTMTPAELRRAAAWMDQAAGVIPKAEIRDLARKLRAEAEGRGWQPIETAPKNRKLIVGYRNRLGNWRTVMACYYLPETLESDSSESGWAEEGWYEESEAYEELSPCDEEPAHWQPLPPGPEAT